MFNGHRQIEITPIPSAEYEKSQFFRYVEEDNWDAAQEVLSSRSYTPTTEDFKRVHELLSNKPIPDVSIEWPNALDNFSRSGTNPDEKIMSAYYGNVFSFINFYKSLIAAALGESEKFSENLQFLENMEVPGVFSEYALTAEEDRLFTSNPKSILYSYCIDALLENPQVTRGMTEQALVSDIGFKHKTDTDDDTEYFEIEDKRLELLELYIERFADDESYRIGLEVYSNTSGKGLFSQKLYDHILKICRKTREEDLEKLFTLFDEYEAKLDGNEQALDYLDALRCVTDSRLKVVNGFGQIEIAGREVQIDGKGMDIIGDRAQLVSRRGEVAVFKKELSQVVGLLNTLGLRQGMNFRTISDIDAKSLGLPNIDYAADLQNRFGVAVETVQALYEDFIKHPRLKELNIDLFDYSLKEQSRLMLLLFTMEEGEWKTFSNACLEFPELLCLAVRIDYTSSEILDVIKKLRLDEEGLFTKVNFRRDLNNLVEIQESVFRDTELNDEEKIVIEYGLNNLARRVTEHNLEISGGKKIYGHIYLDSKDSENPTNLRVIKGLAYIGLTTDLLTNEQVDLEKHVNLLGELEELVKTDRLVKTKVKKILYKLGMVAPTPEYHWRVDRNIGDYNERANLDIPAIIKDMQEGKEDSSRLVCVEIGPGNGTAKRELTAKFGESLIQYAVCDKAFFPLGKYIESIINFDLLEKEVGVSLNKRERQDLADYIYRVVGIKKGQTALDEFEYDYELLDKLTVDLTKISEVISETFNVKLAEARQVPSTISARNSEGEVIYPNKIKFEELTDNTKKALESLVNSGDTYIRRRSFGPNQDSYYEDIDIDVTGILFSEMHELSRLKPGSIDLEIAMRSSVYYSEERYTELITQIYQKLSDRGLTIDDSIRNNDGNGYRLDAAYALKRECESLGLPIYIYIVMGPGFDNEDYREDLSVPKCMVMTKNPGTIDILKRHTYGSSKVEILEIDQLVKLKGYIGRLNKGNETLAALKELGV